MDYIHPCLKCGACCAHFRVSFHWSETLSESFGVPLELTEPVASHILAFKGTNNLKPRCQALVGNVGESIKCNIYENRSSTCRDFLPSYENGERNPSCDLARAAFDLPPLTIADWKNPSQNPNLPL